MSRTAQEIYSKLKAGKTKYIEEIHCPKLLEIMFSTGRISAFCAEVLISDTTFYTWCREHELLREIYSVSKVMAREKWEKEGEELKTKTCMPGVIDHEFDHWRMIGWSRFGISKNSRIKLDLDPNGNPSQHYSQLLKQASEGDFTAAEIKQLMEAVNVGLNTHQVINLQKEIDQLRSDLAIMTENANGNNSSTNKRAAQKD
jgi:hypothetical protein